MCDGAGSASAALRCASAAEIGPPKNGKTRTVPLTTTALVYWVAAKEGKDRDDLLPVTARGMQIRANNFNRRAYDDAIEAVNRVAMKANTAGESGGVTCRTVRA